VIDIRDSQFESQGIILIMVKKPKQQPVWEGDKETKRQPHQPPVELDENSKKDERREEKRAKKRERKESHREKTQQQQHHNTIRESHREKTQQKQHHNYNRASVEEESSEGRLSDEGLKHWNRQRKIALWMIEDAAAPDKRLDRLKKNIQESKPKDLHIYLDDEPPGSSNSSFDTTESLYSTSYLARSSPVPEPVVVEPSSNKKKKKKKKFIGHTLLDRTLTRQMKTQNIS